MWLRVHPRVGIGLLAMLLAMATIPATAQKASRARPQARNVPVAAPAVVPFSLVEPAVDAGARGKAVYPAGNSQGVPAMVYHGARPGPVIAFLLHGFRSADAFYAETEAVFDGLPLETMQGTVLALSLPGRATCAPECATDPNSPWAQLSDGLLETSRFVVELHQQPGRPADFAPHAFVYLPAENARLATYVKALASAALIGNVVELRQGELETENVQHLAARAVEKGLPALSIEGTLLEGNTSAQASQLRKGLVNVLRHLKMVSGGVGWQNASKRMKAEQLPEGFFRGE